MNRRIQKGQVAIATCLFCALVSTRVNRSMEGEFNRPRDDRRGENW
ncbi:hypothetical protein [Microbacterium gubbeenense]